LKLLVSSSSALLNLFDYLVKEISSRARMMCVMMVEMDVKRAACHWIPYIQNQSSSKNK